MHLEVFVVAVLLLQDARVVTVQRRVCVSAKGVGRGPGTS